MTKARKLPDSVMYAAPEKPFLEATMSPNMGPVKNNAVNVRVNWGHWAEHSNSASRPYCFVEKIVIR